jgi:hypothetical protein
MSVDDFLALGQNSFKPVHGLHRSMVFLLRADFGLQVVVAFVQKIRQRLMAAREVGGINNCCAKNYLYRDSCDLWVIWYTQPDFEGRILEVTVE